MFDIFGNGGLGTDNEYEGTGNVWIGDRNKISGADNTVEGDDNAVKGENNGVVGGVNDIQGKQNAVTGSGNKVIGEGNIVQGTGNIISNDPNSISFDIESRLPAWMRTPKTTTADKTTTPVISTTTEKARKSASPTFDRRFSKGGEMRFSTTRRPSYREVTHSPGRTEVREVYETPHSRSEVYRTFSRGPGVGKQKTVQSWSGSWNSDMRNPRQDWRMSGQDWRAPTRGRQSMRGMDWSQPGDWNNWDIRPRENAWNNLRQNNRWANEMRMDVDRSGRDLRTRIQNEVQQNLDRAFRNAFY